MEKNIGIQKYKDDPSLSDLEVAKVAKWADSGAPRGNPADMPPAKNWGDDSTWRIGTPDLVVKTKDILVKGNSPDWWGEIESVPIPMDSDRYVLAVEVKEVNDVDTSNKDRQTVGGRYVWHHLIYRTQVGLDTPSDLELLAGSENVVNWPVHEVGRNPDYFDPKAAVLLKKGSYNAGKRPSQHDIGETSFLKNNGGAIPSNVLTYANTLASDAYQTYCKDNQLQLHPARMPSELAKFFIKFLTEPGDIVLDPFGGSNTTGAAAEDLERFWISIEASEDYIKGSRGRFDGRITLDSFSVW